MNEIGKTVTKKTENLITEEKFEEYDQDSEN